MSYSIPVFNRPFHIPKNVDNAVVQIYTRMGCAPDEPGYFEDFKVLPRPTSKDAALKELAFVRSCIISDRFRLKLEDWDTGNVEFIE